jgi:hypothetical protein
MRVNAALISVLMCTTSFAQIPSPSQMEPREVLTVAISGLQTGRLYTPMFNPQVVDQIRQGTAHTMKVPELAALGRVKHVMVIGEGQPYGGGTHYEMVATHELGKSIWRLVLAQSPPFHPGPDLRVELLDLRDIETLRPEQIGKDRACALSPDMCRK